MLTASLGALLLSLLPFVIRFLGVDPPLAWRYSAGLAAMVFGHWLVRNPRKYLRLSPADRATVRPVLMWLFQSASSLVAAALAGAAFGLEDHADGVYFLSLYCLAGSSCCLIVRFLFARPHA